MGAPIAPRRRPAAMLRQRGVAVITALLLTTLAVTIVASLFWQQQVQVRSMENQRLQLQTRWILRGALDWARLILRQDGSDSAQTTLTGVWATPLAETRLDQYIERERVEGENFDATLSGQISDAQSRYNLASLAVLRKVDPEQQAIFGRLLSNLRLDPALAKTVAETVARSQSGTPMTGDTASGQPPPKGGADTQAALPPVSANGGEPMEMMRVEDLLAISGFTALAVERLREFVIVLPEPTKVNVNTAPAEVLAALLNESVSEATAQVNERKRAYYKEANDFKSRIGSAHTLGPGVEVVVKSGYFLVASKVRLDRAALDAVALIRRENGNNFLTTVSWIREY